MSERSITERSNPYWPFGPSETEQWERLLKERPDLAPAVEKLGNTQSTNGGGLPVGTKEKLTQSEKPDSANGDREKEAQPELCRTLDGDTHWLELANTYRSERLQALGNGVVPLTAALAFSVLWERIKQH
jgi:hypothetical protein